VLLRVLAEFGGSARPVDVYPRVTAAFPEITASDLGELLTDGKTNRWTNRIQWARQDLAELGLVDTSERGVWKLSEDGKRLAAANPSRIDRPPRKRLPKPHPPPGPVDVPGAPRPTILKPSLEALVEELSAAASDSRGPERLELALAEAFRHLGFEAERIGGAGRTDVLLNASLGLHRYRVVIDAKSTNRTRVSDAQVDWLSIRTHRERERADYAAVIGPEFAGGNLTDRAREFDVALLSVPDLLQVIELHAMAPFTLVELRTLFDAKADIRASLASLRAAANARARRMLLPRRLLGFIDNFNQVQPDLILAKPETLLALVIQDKELLGTTLDDVRRALSLLETLGVLAAQNGDGYVSQTSLAGAEAFLNAVSAKLQVHATASVQLSSPTALA
jgi:hypothetical protein